MVKVPRKVQLVCTHLTRWIEESVLVKPPEKEGLYSAIHSTVWFI